MARLVKKKRRRSEENDKTRSKSKTDYLENTSDKEKEIFFGFW